MWVAYAQFGGSLSSSTMQRPLHSLTILEAVQDDILLYFVLSFDNRIIGEGMI